MDQATLMDKIKTGTTLCKAIMRNGYDAYAINAPLQGLIFEKTGVFDVDIACACDTETLFKIFPNAVPYTEEGAMAMLQENGVTLRFYSTDVEDASHPEMSQLRHHAAPCAPPRRTPAQGPAQKFQHQRPRS